MAKLTFPITLHTRTNLTGTTVPAEVASKDELVDELKRSADATDENAENVAEQLLSGAEVNLTVRGRETTLYATQD